MDPNSKNQRWSLWTYRVYPDMTKRPTFESVKVNCARFGKKAFGFASEMHIVCALENGRVYWEIKIRTEGHNVHEPAYVKWMHAQWDTFFRHGFGRTCEVQSIARLEAGDRQDGKPADQLIIMPSLILTR